MSLPTCSAATLALAVLATYWLFRPHTGTPERELAPPPAKQIERTGLLVPGAATAGVEDTALLADVATLAVGDRTAAGLEIPWLASEAEAPTRPATPAATAPPSGWILRRGTYHYPPAGPLPPLPLTVKAAWLRRIAQSDGTVDADGRVNAEDGLVVGAIRFFDPVRVPIARPRAIKTPAPTVVCECEDCADMAQRTAADYAEWLHQSRTAFDLSAGRTSMRAVIFDAFSEAADERTDDARVAMLAARILGIAGLLTAPLQLALVREVHEHCIRAPFGLIGASYESPMHRECSERMNQRVDAFHVRLEESLKTL